jgi:hypothetical protein
MYRTRKLVFNILAVEISSIVGAILMMGFETGGTRWLKFRLYSIFFASISSPAIFSSSYSCSAFLAPIA